MPVVDAADYGLSPAASASDNGAAMSAAAAAAGRGGGVVVSTGGPFPLSGAQLLSRVTVDLGTATFVHPDGNTSTHMFRSKVGTTTASGSASGTTITVADASDAVVGGGCAIEGAGHTYDGNAMVLYTTVVSVSGTTVTVADALQATVTGATCTFGAVGVSVVGGTLDGSRTDGVLGNQPFPIILDHAVGCQLVGQTITSGQHGAVMLRNGSVDNDIVELAASDCGQPSEGLGAIVWMFRGAQRNTLARSTLGGSSFHGVVIDDRTTGFSVYDGPCDGNRVTRTSVTLPRYADNYGVLVNGSSHNQIVATDVTGPRVGFSAVGGGQGVERTVTNNRVVASKASGCRYGVSMGGESNVVEDTYTPDCDTGTNDTGTSNVFVRSGTDAGADMTAARAARHLHTSLSL